MITFINGKEPLYLSLVGCYLGVATKAISQFKKIKQYNLAKHSKDSYKKLNKGEVSMLYL